MMKRCFDGDNGMIDFGKEHLRRFIDAYKEFIYSASGLDEADLNELAESI